MNILLVSDAPLDESEIGYKAQNIAMELLKHEHTVTVISFEYTRNDTHPFNAKNILFNNDSIPFEIPVYEKCRYSNTLYHNLSSENIKIIREKLGNEIDKITHMYGFDAIVFSHTIPFFILKNRPEISTFVMAEIDEANLINEAGLPDYIKIHNYDFSLIYSDTYSLGTVKGLFENEVKIFKWGGYYNRSIYRYHEEDFTDILNEYEFPQGKNIILPPLNLTKREINCFVETARLFHIFKYDTNFIIIANDDTTEFENNIPDLKVIHPKNRFHTAVLYNNSTAAVIPAEMPSPSSVIFELIASGVKVLTKQHDFMSKFKIPRLFTVNNLDSKELAQGIIEMLDSPEFTKEELKDVKRYSFQDSFTDFLKIIEEHI